MRFVPTSALLQLHDAVSQLLCEILAWLMCTDFFQPNDDNQLIRAYFEAKITIAISNTMVE